MADRLNPNRDSDIQAPDGSVERTARRNGRRPTDYRVLLGVLPLVAFWVGYQWHTYAAIGLGFVATIAAYHLSGRKGVVGLLAVFVLVVTAGAAIVGLILGDERAFLARDAASDFLMALIALGTLAFRRPLVGMVVREFAPRTLKILPPNHWTFIGATLAVALVNLLQGSVRAWMLVSEMSVGQYLVYSRLFGVPLTIAMFVVVTVIIRKGVEQARLERTMSG